ncbi:MarR family transcriptional regulator [Amycolatopsis alkalitolerans]|uniref:MarR family transcriptional regulator n=1 Tax=Amycolatopsis alkalitolerans TaxID=2547244 RepID=A0A5C4LXV7_9PSEU|nr:MarR family transcriptional regulator [Amycolatopsis alkalitolerans]TNC23446.1 MarR family transcriptional regulator [Amycolatopsis alkalitolerans]
MTAHASAETARRRRRLVTGVKDALRDLNRQLSVLDHRVGARAKLKDADLDCLDIISRQGPLGPSALARLAGLHPATITGILDRLERDGWVVRERDPDDRRAVVVRALRERGGELFRLYGGMNRSMDELIAGYRDDELELLAGFLRRVTEAGEQATNELNGPTT